jgi:DNA-binding transcriptional ArsR family regulator
MSARHSIADVLTDLEAQVTELEQQLELHARQEVHHREQKEQCAAKLETLRQGYEEFKQTAGKVLELTAARPLPRREDEGPDLGGKPRLSRVLDVILAGKAAGETVTASQITREMLARFGRKLDGGVDTRSVSAQLRRLSQRGKLHLVQEGRSHHEAIYKMP